MRVHVEFRNKIYSLQVPVTEVMLKTLVLVPCVPVVYMYLFNFYVKKVLKKVYINEGTEVGTCMYNIRTHYIQVVQTTGTSQKVVQVPSCTPVPVPVNYEGNFTPGTRGLY